MSAPSPASGSATKGHTRLGVDFDNTLVCYDEAFARLAQERGLVPPNPGEPGRGGEGDVTFKQRLRDHLRTSGREDVWTELQGVAYGERIGEARPFEGALECLRACAQSGVEIFVVSHKTRVPYAGAPSDLRAAASGWLAANGFTGAGAPLCADRVYFESTRDEKVRRIAALGCTHFVDDLPELLADPALAADLVRVLFDPRASARPESAVASGIVLARSWRDIQRVVIVEAQRSQTRKEISAA